MTKRPTSTRIAAKSASASGLNVGTGRAATYVNPPISLPEIPRQTPASVTTTSTAPAAWAGVVAVIVVELTTITVVAATPPNVTVEGSKKLVPLIVTAVPPVIEPVFG